VQSNSWKKMISNNGIFDERIMIFIFERT